MSGCIRRRSILLVVVLALCAGCAAFGNSGPRTTSGSSTAAAAESIAVHCNGSVLDSCLEKTPAGETDSAEGWAGNQTTPAILLVDYYYASAYWAPKTAEYEQAGIQAAAREVYRSQKSGGPWASVVLARFANAQGAATEAVGIDLDGFDVTDWPGKRISVPGLPGYAYPGGKVDSGGYLRTDYAVAVGNLLMIFEFFSQRSFDQTDFAVWARGQYLSLKSATIPATALTAEPAATLSCALASCLIAAPAGDLPWGGDWGSATTVTTNMYVNWMYDPSLQPVIADELKAEGLIEAAHTTWIDDGPSHPGTVQADVILLRFSSDQGAQLHILRQTANTDTDTFNVPGPGAAVGYTSDKPDSEGNYEEIVYGCVGAVEVEIHVLAPQAPDRTDAASIARRQLARLAARTTAAGS